MRKITSVNIFGTKISAINYNDAISIISQNIRKKPQFVCVAAVHLLMESYADKKLQRLINKSLITTPDGMPIKWLLRFILKKQTHRVYGPDLTLKLCEFSQKNGYKVFFLGGSRGQSRDLRKNILDMYPKLKIVGMQETPLRPIPIRQNNKIIKEINIKKPDIIFVGLGCPLQEKWMVENYFYFKRGVFVGVGAAFDFISGYVRQAPRWMQNIGLEWLFRLSQDPKRLWKRYLILNTKFIIAVLRKYNTFRVE